MRRVFVPFFLTVPLVAMGCDTGAPAAEHAAEQSADASAAPAAPTGLIPNTPPGGLERWVEDIRTGLADLPQRAAEDMAAAQDAALDLYIGRQEYLELYYGELGRYRATDELATAITEDEAAFHQLLQMVNPAATTTADPEQIQAQLDLLNARLDEVLVQARAAGIDLTQPVAPGS